MPKITTRFAPSPTGFLHIGGARTALFNFLYAQHHNGTYHIRIEDTDKARSTDEAKNAIIEGLSWLDLLGDQKIIFQSKNLNKHRAIAEQLLKENKAYYCYCSPEELQQRREAAKQQGKHFTGYDRRCRNLTAPPPNKPAAVRIKAPLIADETQAEESYINDLVQGTTHIPHNILDDFIILRQDGTPTYMLSVVVDDHDMNITHIIRGDDHLMNAHRQKIIFDACGWTCPQFAHIPLIHGADGKKLSKRHGALAVAEYRSMGYLAEAVNNHILRLGWGHGDQEFFSRAQAIKLFDIAQVGKGAAQFDFAKLDFFNHRYIAQLPDAELQKQTNEFLPQDLKENTEAQTILKNSLPFLKSSANNLKELADNAMAYMRPEKLAEEARDAEFIACAIDILSKMETPLGEVQNWHKDVFKPLFKEFEKTHGYSTKQIMQSMRAALLGKIQHPGAIGDILSALGKQESLQRIANCIKYLT